MKNKNSNPNQYKYPTLDKLLAFYSLPEIHPKKSCPITNSLHQQLTQTPTKQRHTPLNNHYSRLTMKNNTDDGTTHNNNEPNEMPINTITPAPIIRQTSMSKWVNNTGMTKLTESLFQQLHMDQHTLEATVDINHGVQYEHPNDTIEPSLLNTCTSTLFAIGTPLVALPP
jgi:hypothetical protein